LQDALLRSAAAADSVGARAVVAHAISGDAVRFYERFGFEASPSDPHHLILLMKDLPKLFSAGAAAQARFRARQTSSQG
jgi:hypothetical protein